MRFYGNISNQLMEIGSRELIVGKVACRAMGVVVFVVLTALGAFVYVPLPFTPVPITLQTFFVLLSGAFLGGAWGSLSQLGYVILGSLGLPIFSGAKGGFIRLLGPTGGYLFGFIVAAQVIGWLVRKKKKAGWIWLVFSMVVGSSIIYLLGAFQLAFVVHCGAKKAFLLGVLPFIPGDFLKLIAACYIYRKLEMRISRIFPG